METHPVERVDGKPTAGRDLRLRRSCATRPRRRPPSLWLDAPVERFTWRGIDALDLNHLSDACPPSSALPHRERFSVPDHPNLVRATLDSGTELLVEVRATDDPERDVSLEDRFDFEGLTNSIVELAEHMSSAVERVSPNRASIELGLDVGVATNGLTALLVRGTGNATVRLTLEWERRPVTDAGG